MPSTKSDLTSSLRRSRSELLLNPGLFGRIELATRGFDVLPCVADPVRESRKGLQHRFSAIGQLIFNAWWQFGIIVPCDEPIPLKIAKSKRQHTLRDIGNAASKGAEPHRCIGESESIEMTRIVHLSPRPASTLPGAQGVKTGPRGVSITGRPSLSAEPSSIGLR